MKPIPVAAVFLAALTLAAGAHAQHKPYAGEQQRDIKALSADEIKQYLEGAGMGYAKSAELNHYPGPVHALELADPLRLTSEQRAQTRRLMEEHRAEARGIGAKLVEAERALEAAFRTGKVDQASLAEAVRKAAALQGDYRLSHLETHRRLRAILTDDQVVSYDSLRGYDPAGGDHRH
ncbi:MAG: Spy/CpxP family protein refolding chaperone [Pseudomonadota bacterium]|nr:Spy/CpxP family protein refolding chaperone [Pseudomonadota bacterium]